MSFLLANGNPQKRDTFRSMWMNIPYCLDAVAAETLGFLKALQFATEEVEISHLTLEGDAVLVVQIIHSKAPNLSNTGLLIDGIRSLSNTCPDLEINHVNRANNTAAHEGSKIALHSISSNVWYPNFSEYVVLAANFDLHQ